MILDDDHGLAGGPTAAPRAFVHQTVLLRETIDALGPKPGGLYVDVTLGGGGHSEELLRRAPGAVLLGIDRDPRALSAAERRLRALGPETSEHLHLVHAPFGDVAEVAFEVLSRLSRTAVDGLVADLGVSSPQLDDPTRGLSLRADGPLDMRMDPTRGETVLQLIGRLDDEQLANVIFEFGDERRSRAIARSIHRALAEDRLRGTSDLRAAVHAVSPRRPGDTIDPATRTFQALRIAVNDELGELDRLLAALPTLVAPGGVAAIISFHSLEDRRVKHAFGDLEVWVPLHKGVVVAGDDEVGHNPRSHSAKLRAARRRLPGEIRADDRQAKYEAKRARRGPKPGGTS